MSTVAKCVKLQHTLTTTAAPYCVTIRFWFIMFHSFNKSMALGTYRHLLFDICVCVCFNLNVYAFL